MGWKGRDARAVGASSTHARTHYRVSGDTTTDTHHTSSSRRFLADEHREKKEAVLDMSGWTLVPSSSSVTPQQTNYDDCGWFVLAFAYVMTLGLPFRCVRNAGWLLG